MANNTNPKDPVNLRLGDLHSFVGKIGRETKLGKQEAIRRMLRWLAVQETKGKFNSSFLVSELEKI